MTVRAPSAAPSLVSLCLTVGAVQRPLHFYHLTVLDDRANHSQIREQPTCWCSALDSVVHTTQVDGRTDGYRILGVEVGNRRLRGTFEMKLRQIIPGQVLNLDQLHYIASRNKQQDTRYSEAPSPARSAAKRTSVGRLLAHPPVSLSSLHFGLADRPSLIDRQLRPTQRPPPPAPHPLPWHCCLRRPKRGPGSGTDNRRIPGRCRTFKRPPTSVLVGFSSQGHNNDTGEFRLAIYCIVKRRYFVTTCSQARHTTIESHRIAPRESNHRPL